MLVERRWQSDCGCANCRSGGAAISARRRKNRKCAGELWPYRFGSRCDVYLPEGAVPLVAIGQSAIAGETVLADLLSDEPERETQTA